MKTFLLHEPFNIYHFATREWTHAEHRHTYFEIIFILKGRGIYILNGKSLDYRQGDIFFLAPEDYHSFRIERETEFCYIRFTAPPSHQPTTPAQVNPAKGAFPGDNFIPSSGIRVSVPTDRVQLHSLLTVLRAEYENRFRDGFEVIRNGIMSAMITILNRNLHHDTPVERSARYVDVSEIVSYVRVNILSPNKLSVANLAARFNYSPTYISNFFKQQTGEPLKTFILKTRLKRVETKLLYSNASLSELADEF